MGKNTGGKRTLRGDLIERRGSSEAWDEESQPPGGKGPLRPHVIVRPRGSRRVEAVGSHEVWNRRESTPTGGKRTLRGDLIERGGSSEAWDEESQPPGGKGPLRPHVIEAGGSTEGWYGEPPGIRTEPGLFRDACCDSRCSRPAGLFSLGLLDVPQGTPPSPSLPSSPGGLRPQLSRDGLPE